MKLTLSPADKKLLNEVFAPDVIEKRAPQWFKDSLAGIGEMAKIQDEISYRGRHIRDAAGFSEDRSVQKVAHFPDAMTVNTILNIDPEIMTNEKKLLAFLDSPAGKPFDLRKRHRK